MPDRRGFLGAVAALAAAPWVPFPKPEMIRGWDLGRARADPIYFLQMCGNYYVFTPHETLLLKNLSDDGFQPQVLHGVRRWGG